MTKSEAITLSMSRKGRFPVLVWQEGNELVSQVDGIVVRATTAFQMDTKLDGIAPQPRDLYFVDHPDYEDEQGQQEVRQ